MKSSLCALLFLLEACESRRLFAATFTIDASQNVHSISKFIYGVNSQGVGNNASYSNVTSIRAGGNRWTAYNWENNASNAGSDYQYENDGFLGGGTTPGGAVIPTLTSASSHNAAAIVTIPINGYVSADESPGGDVRNSGANYLSTRFKQIVPVKGSAFSLTPNTTDAYVYTDEYINWFKSNYGYGQTDPSKPIIFELDNEPDLWASTHAEVHPSAVTYAEMISKTVANASAIKSVEPNSVVFGPVNYGWQGYVNLQGAPDANGRDFQSYYLQQIAAASATAGKRLIDALDVHWYPEATGTNGVRITNTDGQAATVAARLQAPRSLWDPTYTESSWITKDSLHGPIDLLPRLQAKIDANYPGTKLAMTEYNYGGGTDISGAIAEADVLGILGVQKVYDANEWPLLGSEPFIAGALKLYRNYDGAGSTFGDVSIGATSNDVANTSVYASYDSASRKTLTLVAINKSAGSNVASINLANLAPGATATAYQIAGTNSSAVSAGTINLNGGTSFNYTMPGYSVTLIKIPLTTAAPIAWTGGGDGTNLANAANWSTNTVPATTDDAVISVATANPLISLSSGTVSLHNLVSDESISLSGSATLSVAGSARVNSSLTLTGSASLKLAAGGTGSLRVNSLSIAASTNAKVDLADNPLIVDYVSGADSPQSTITSLIRSGRADGAWTGGGLTSSVAQSNVYHNTTLGVMESHDFQSIYGSSATFAGQSVDDSAVLVKYTFYGDTDFNGRVDANDYGRIDAGYQNQLTSGFLDEWFSGDLNGDGKIDANDYALIDAAYQTQNSVTLLPTNVGSRAVGTRATFGILSRA